MDDVQLFCPRCDSQRTRQPQYQLHNAGPVRRVIPGQRDGWPMVRHFVVNQWYCPTCMTNYFESVTEE